MIFDDLVDIGQAQSEAFHVVHIAGGDTIEANEDLLQVFFFDADPVVLDEELELAVLVAGAGHEAQGHFLSAILDGVVQQVEEHVGQVHLIGVDGGVQGAEIEVDRAAIFLHLEREGAHHGGQEVVRVDLLELERRLLSFKERHLQDLLHEEAQSPRFVVDDGRDVFEHLGLLREVRVAEHLGGQ